MDKTENSRYDGESMRREDSGYGSKAGEREKRESKKTSTERNRMRTRSGESEFEEGMGGRMGHCPAA